LKRTASIAGFVSILFLSISAFAHDYWLEPDAFIVKPGQQVIVRMFLGEHLVSEEERPFKELANVRFELFSNDGRSDLASRAQDDETPVAKLDLKKSGTYLVAMERKPQSISIEADRFTNYLKEEGLDAIVRERESRGETGTEGRERYRRFLKTLILVGDKRDDVFKTIVGHELEVVPAGNPYDAKPGDTLKLTVLFQGKPLTGATVFAHNRDNGKVSTQTLRTAADGTIVVKLDHPGQWLVRMVHMRRCVSCKDIDWESFWTSFSFGVNPAGS
jgi:uncharacterized GH25 family protein